MWTSFSRQSPDWGVVKNFDSPNQKTTMDRGRNNQLEEKETLARLASGF
jgi:hypothetical protein